jgi:hypothetical protein
MNERINELWARAVDAAVPETYTSLSWAQIEKIKSAFAELIVKECCKIMADHPDRPAGVIKRNIKEHFGVEE